MKAHQILVRVFLPAAIVACLVSSPRADRDAEVPAAVRSMIERLFPGTTIAGAREDEKDDEEIIELELRRDDGREIQVDVSKDGELLEIDDRIPEEEIPPRVLAALKKTFREMEIEWVEKETQFEIVYRFEVKSKGRKREVAVSRRGKILEIEKR